MAWGRFAEYFGYNDDAKELYLDVGQETTMSKAFTKEYEGSEDETAAKRRRELKLPADRRTTSRPPARIG